MQLIDEDNKLISAEEIKRRAKLAGTHASTYWVSAIAPAMRTLPHHQRQRMCERAFQVATNIIPVPTMDNILLPALIAKPMPDTIKWTTLGQQYGVDYRYIAASYLRALERLLARTDEITRAKLTRRSQVTNTSTVQLITSICVQKIAQRADLNALIATRKFPNTLDNFAKYDTFAIAAERHIEAVQRKQRLANQRYDAGTSWAEWRHERTEAINTKADRITGQLLNWIATDPITSPVKHLANLLTTVTRRRPPLAAVLMYAHAHILPRLAKANRWDVAEAINAHTLHYAAQSLTSRRNTTSRIVISRLTGTLLPDTPPASEDSERIRAMIQRCRGMEVLK